MTLYTLNATTHGSYTITGESPALLFGRYTDIMKTGYYSISGTVPRMEANYTGTGHSGLIKQGHSPTFIRHWWRGNWPASPKG